MKYEEHQINCSVFRFRQPKAVLYKINRNLCAMCVLYALWFICCVLCEQQSHIITINSPKSSFAVSQACSSSTLIQLLANSREDSFLLCVCACLIPCAYFLSTYSDFYLSIYLSLYIFHLLVHCCRVSILRELANRRKSSEPKQKTQ